MLAVATAIQHGAFFKNTASCCDLPQRQYFEDLVNENRGVLSYYKNPHLLQNYKKQCSLFWFVCMFYVHSSEMTISSSSVTAQHFNNNAQKKHTKKSLPVRRGQAKILPPKIHVCVLCVRVLCKTRRSFIRSFSQRLS